VEARARAELGRWVAPKLAAFGGRPDEAARWAARVNLGNAALLARLTYAGELDVFESVYRREGEDVRRAVARVIALARASEGDAYAGLRGWLAQRPTARGDGRAPGGAPATRPAARVTATGLAG
jgi:predicted aminopeptidase